MCVGVVTVRYLQIYSRVRSSDRFFPNVAFKEVLLSQFSAAVKLICYVNDTSSVVCIRKENILDGAEDELCNMLKLNRVC